MISKRSFWKSFVTSLLITGTTLSASVFGVAQKAEAQTASGLLTSGLGRWLERNNRIPACYIYDFKPSGARGVLRVLRQTYAVNFVTGQCRFSLGPIGSSFGSVAQVNNNVVTIQYGSSPTSGEQIQLLQLGRINGRPGILIRRGRVTSTWQQSSR
ncbi:MAG: hypothetical protein AAF757_02960 [Cyanobacteria bacterium P01_D01_bin.116]